MCDDCDQVYCECHRFQSPVDRAFADYRWEMENYQRAAESIKAKWLEGTMPLPPPYR